MQPYIAFMCRLNFEVFVEDVQELIDQETSPHPAPKDLASFDYEVYHTFDEVSLKVLIKQNKRTTSVSSCSREFFR